MTKDDILIILYKLKRRFYLKPLGDNNTIHSSDHAIDGYRPKLVIVYTEKVEGVSRESER